MYGITVLAAVTTDGIYHLRAQYAQDVVEEGLIVTLAEMVQVLQQEEYVARAIDLLLKCGYSLQVILILMRGDQFLLDHLAEVLAIQMSEV